MWLPVRVTAARQPNRYLTRRAGEGRLVVRRRTSVRRTFADPHQPSADTMRFVASAISASCGGVP